MSKPIYFLFVVVWLIQSCKTIDIRQTPADKSGKHTQPSMILGYKEKIVDTGTGSSSGMGNTSNQNKRTEHVKTVGFYNSTGTIITIDWSTLKKTLQNINN